MHKMIEHDFLMQYSGEGDNPICFCLCRIGAKIDWKDNLPDEVLYVPEGEFFKVAPRFIEIIDFYGSVAVSDEYELVLRHDLSKHFSSEEHTNIARQVLSFIEKSKELNKSHYLMFEGP